MARKTPEEAERTRQRLLASGAYTFAKIGFTCTTLEMIAKHAGVTRGAVYWHFKGKENLLQAILQDRTLPLESFLSHGANLDENLQRLRAAVKETFTNVESRQLCEIMLHRNEHSESEAPITQRLRRVQSSFMDQVQQFLEDAVRQGELDPDLNISATSRIFQVCMTGLILECLHGSLDIARQVRMTLDVIGDMLLKPPTPLLRLPGSL